MTPPEVSLAEGVVTELSGERVLSLGGAPRGYAREVGTIREVRLTGTPEQVGQGHALLLKAEMDRTEGVVWALFRQHVTSRLARALLIDLTRLRYGALDRAYDEPRRLELAAQALSYQPDPFEGELPTYQRLVYLNAVYDISLSYEQSPLIGCTSFTGAGPEGGGILGRAFDFEVDPIFDREKVVFLVREEGKQPFASVAWAGLVGVVSGMNLSGVSAVVHGARAGEPRDHGEPVVHALRRVLSEATTSEQAVQLLAAREPLVSHLVVLSDARADARVVERVPGQPDQVRRLSGAACVTNHLEGAAAKDERNRRVRELTSTLDRRRRGDELTGEAANLTVERAAEWLRDRRLVGGQVLELGDRRAIDAGIATHGIIADSARRVLWVSAGPNLEGEFIAFDLKALLAAEPAPRGAPHARLPAPPRAP